MTRPRKPQIVYLISSNSALQGKQVRAVWSDGHQAKLFCDTANKIECNIQKRIPKYTPMIWAVEEFEVLR